MNDDRKGWIVDWFLSLVFRHLSMSKVILTRREETIEKQSAKEEAYAAVSSDTKFWKLTLAILIAFVEKYEIFENCSNAQQKAFLSHIAHFYFYLAEKMPKFKHSNATFWVIFKQCGPTLKLLRWNATTESIFEFFRQK